MAKLLLDFYNALFNPNKIFNSSKNSFFIPILIFLLFMLSPVFLYNPVFRLIGHFDALKIKLLLFILFFSYLSAGIRVLFVFNNEIYYYPYLSSISPLILGILGKNLLYFAVVWSICLKIYIDLKSKNYFSLIVGLIFDVFLVFWLI